MRALPVLLCLLASPVAAWDAWSDGTLCHLDHAEPHVTVELTFDPSGPLYSITLTRADAPWPQAEVFAIAFSLSAPLTISTTRHQLSGASLRVADTGFGNVLDGLSFNETATAQLGDSTVAVDLTGARPEVEAFRDCTRKPPGTA